MSYKIYIEKNVEIPPGKVELLTIGGKVAAPTFTGIGDSNTRLADAKALVSACATSIKKTVGLSVTPGIYFVYRGVAVGGLQRGLGGFSSKPLTVKNKSIDPGIIKDDADFARLTGLVPMQVKLGKKGRTDDTSSIPLSLNQGSYKIAKIEDVGNAKSYLCCGTSNRNLSWEDAAIPTGKSLCTFLGDTTNPYLADWDLVLVGVTKASIKDDSTLRCFKVIDAGGAGPHNLLPQWLADCLKTQKVPLISHVTQHGPESLYCGNDITQSDEEFLVLTLSADSASGVTHKVINQDSSDLEGTMPWDKAISYIGANFGNYFSYKFSAFSGKGDSKPTDYSTPIDELNGTLTG
jgi:hypothetical protein